MTDRLRYIRFLVEAKYPEFDASLRSAHQDALKARRGTSDTSDEVLSDVLGCLEDSLVLHQSEKSAEFEAGSRADRLTHLRHIIDAALSYESSLWDMPDAKLLELYGDEKQRIEKADSAFREDNDRLAPFNLPNAQTDLVHWASMPHWTVDEAVAVSLGRNPTIVTHRSLQHPRYKNRSNFVLEFERRRDLLTRAIAAHEVSEPIKPNELAIWASGRGLPWFDAIMQAKAQPAPERDLELEERYNAAIAERDALRAKLADLLTDVDDLHPRSKTSLLRLVLGMAILRFEYTTKGRSNTAKLVSGEFEEIGIPITDETILRWVREAAAELDFHWEQPREWTAVPKIPKPKSEN